MGLLILALNDRRDQEGFCGIREALDDVKLVLKNEGVKKALKRDE